MDFRGSRTSLSKQFLITDIKAIGLLSLRQETEGGDSGDLLLFKDTNDVKPGDGDRQACCQGRTSHRVNADGLVEVEEEEALCLSNLARKTKLLFARK